MKISQALPLLLAVLICSDVAIAVQNKTFLRHHDLSATKPRLLGIPMTRRELSEEHLQKKLEFVQESQKQAIQKAKTVELMTMANSSEDSDDSSVKHNIKVNNYQNTEFTAQVGVGTPRQNMDVILDTGSSNIWLDSTLCHQSGCQSHTQYDHTLSSTFEANGTTVEVTFGSGPLQGEINYDTFYLDDVAVKNQVVGEIRSMNIPVFDYGDFSGIIGLGFAALATNETSPVFDSIKEQKLVDTNAFTFYLPRSRPTEHQFIFGQIPPSNMYKGDLSWVDVSEQYYWTANLTDFRVGGKSIGVCTSEAPCFGVVDSGTSLNSAPSHHIALISEHLGVTACRNGTPITKNMSYCFGDSCFDLEPEDFLLSGLGSCDYSMMAMDVNHGDQPLLILGDVFMMKHMVVFDKDANRMGFAPYSD